jgi:hypothetical protein
MTSKQLTSIVKGINHTRVHILAEMVFEDYNDSFPEKTNSSIVFHKRQPMLEIHLKQDKPEMSLNSN